MLHLINIHIKERRAFNALNFGIFILYLFQVTAIIGVSLGYQDWFIQKTPFNLSLTFFLLLWLYPVDSSKKGLASLVFFMSGMLVEWLGVNFSLLFGSYEYGDNLGLKIGGVPLLIGVNWMILVLVTGQISNLITQHRWLRVLLGAGLMVLLDFFMEVPAPAFDFWVFEGGVAPASNYIAWFGIACILHAFFQCLRVEGNSKFSVHLYLCQIIFFSYFYLYFSV